MAEVFPEDFGAAGDGSTDDTAALLALSAALNDGDIVVLTGKYLVETEGVGQEWGALQLLGLATITVRWLPFAEIIMDNLDGDGLGTGHAVYATGPTEEIVHEGIARITWATVPDARSIGDGMRYLGYPSDDPGDGPIIGRVVLPHLVVRNAPATGCIFMGVSDPRVGLVEAIDTLADGLHFNACRRIICGDTVGRGTGDDSRAFVTYYHATDVDISGSGIGPYAQPSLGEWSNSGVAGNAYSEGSLANAERIGGAFMLSTGNKVAKDATVAGLSVISSIRDLAHVPPVADTIEGSQGVHSGAVLSTDCEFGVQIEPLNVTGADDARFRSFDVEIAAIDARDPGQFGVLVLAQEATGAFLTGIRLPRIFSTGTVRTIGLRNSELGVVHVDGGDIGLFGDIDGYDGAMGAMPYHLLDVGRLVLNGSGRIQIQDYRGVVAQVVRSIDPTGDGVDLTRLVDSHIEYGQTSGGAGVLATKRGLVVGKVQRTEIGLYEVSYGNVAVGASIEIGGGDADDITTDFTLGKTNIRTARNQTDDDVVIQGGPFAPSGYTLRTVTFNSGEPSAQERREVYSDRVAATLDVVDGLIASLPTSITPGTTGHIAHSETYASVFAKIREYLDLL